MNKFNFIKTEINDLYIIEPNIFIDDRGYFLESYNKKDFFEGGINVDFVQDNESKSQKGVLRGLHFQLKNTQDKLVRITSGTVYDVAVDLRKNSSTFGKYKGVILSDDNKRQFFIPKGFAHGFLVLSDEAVFNYKCSDFYNPQSEYGLLWNDFSININWPLDTIDNLILSDKDLKSNTFEQLIQENLLF